jgi:pilus assembly protein CpaE
VVVDTSGVFDDHALTALDRSDSIVLVGTLDIPALKGLRLATNTLELLNFAKDSWRFVLNRADGRVGLSVDEYESTLSLKADITLVSANEVLNAVNRGEPLVRAYPSHQNSKALARFAATLIDSTSAAHTSDTGGRKAGRLRRRKG